MVGTFRRVFNMMQKKLHLNVVKKLSKTPKNTPKSANQNKDIRLKTHLVSLVPDSTDTGSWFNFEYKIFLVSRDNVTPLLIK